MAAKSRSSWVLRLLWPKYEIVVFTAVAARGARARVRGRGPDCIWVRGCADPAVPDERRAVVRGRVSGSCGRAGRSSFFLSAPSTQALACVAALEVELKQCRGSEIFFGAARLPQEGACSGTSVAQCQSAPPTRTAGTCSCRNTRSQCPRRGRSVGGRKCTNTRGTRGVKEV